MTDFLLLVHPGADFCLPHRSTFPGVIRIVSGIGGQHALFQFKHLCHDPIQKVPVVGNDEYGAGIMD